ncbi:hypothetical protein DDZ18_06200 [Marinicauda salina]|uniref:DNA-binding protein n=1 Tax=Marinicauda salina TaxID=2135793 RepID=A0A2U2BTF2_9PROT|nr:hypothetical protein [Marinicauda salina]PWE17277.1 hypothetical protein DDZ18_06200 [Marinicauda salina]
MKAFEFSIVASGLDPRADDFEDRFFEAGCDDATIAFARGAIVLHFHREAESLSAAIRSARADVEAAGATVRHVEPDNLVSLTEIARRAGLTRSATSLYANGGRGRDFPPPVARVTSDGALWDWREVSAWLHRRGQLPIEDVRAAAAIGAANAELRG